MKKIFEFTTTSDIKLDSIQLWEFVANMQGVNFELAPLVKMTIPKKYRKLTIRDAPIKEQLFKSVILLFQFIPVDIHHFKLEKVVENKQFEENSSSLMHHFWKHTRTLTAVENGTLLVDIIQFKPRAPLIGYILSPIYQWVFRNRHYRLKKKFN